jgi:hypothetical protein
VSGGSYDYLYRRVRDAADKIRRDNEDVDRRPLDPDTYRIRIYDPVTREDREYTGRDALAIYEQIATHRLWLAEHLELVATALHDLEWVDSSDYGPGDEVAAIRRLARPDVSALEDLAERLGPWPPEAP